MACTVNLAQQIAQEAQRQGVDPAIAFSVAQTESGVCQWARDGSVITSSAGARGVFQLLPSSFPGQNIDDLATNISLGIGYLKQLYGKYGNWSQALAAYNFGPSRVDAGVSWPAETIAYVKKILGFSAASTTAPSSNSGGVSVSNILGSVEVPGIPPVILIGGAVLVLWWLWD